MAYVNRVFESLKKKINIFKELIISGVSGFPFWVIEPIRKDENGGIFRKLLFGGKQIGGMLFSWVKTDYLDKNFSKSLIRTETSWGGTETSWGGNNEGLADFNSLWKLVYLGLVEVQTVKIIVLAYGGRVSESLTKKILSFQRFKNFRRFWVLVLKPIRKDGNGGKFTKPCFSSK